MQHPVEQTTRVIRAFAIILDGERLDLVAAQEVSRFSKGNTLTCTGVANPHPARSGGSECLQRAFKSDFIGGVVAVAGKVARQARKHEGHRASFELVDELRQAPELQW